MMYIIDTMAYASRLFCLGSFALILMVSSFDHVDASCEYTLLKNLSRHNNHYVEMKTEH